MLAQWRVQLGELRAREFEGLLSAADEAQLVAVRGHLANATEVAVAANGHRMSYRINPVNGVAIQHSAVCVESCGACRDGEALPDW